MPDSHRVANMVNGTANMEIAQSNQDLIMSKDRKKKRNWIIAIVFAIIVVALIVAAILLLQNGPGHVDRPEDMPPAINLEDFLNYKYNPKTFNGTWASGNQFIYTSDAGDLLLFNLDNNSTRSLLYSNDSIMLTAFDFQLSADNQYLLVAHDYQKLYRHSYKARYTIINLKTENRLLLQEGIGVNGLDLLLVQWGPVENSLVYVFENNIYYKTSAEATESIQITNTTGFITNGMPDWVYEEEVFSSNKALWFSSDGKKLAFVRFNDTDTPIMVVPVYGEPGSLYFQYPRANIIKYPKAGAPNPTVTLFIVNLETNHMTELDIPKELEATQPLITAVTWTTTDSLVAVWMNRVQNQSAIVVYEGLFAKPTTIKSISESRGWVELFVAPKVSADGKQLALLLSKEEGAGVNVDSYRHLALLDVKQNAKESFLTNGTYVVTEILGWNHNDNLIYYTATLPNDSSVQHVYSIAPVSREAKCLTCDLKSNTTGMSCTYNSAEVNSDSSYLVVTCGGPEIPYISIFSSDGSQRLLWTKNDELVGLVTGKILPGREKLEIEISDGFTAKVMLKLPAYMDVSGKTKYPMLVNVYGGPDTYQVTDKFSLDWGSYLAANKSIIYATIDGRGSGLRGNNLLFSGYRKLGTVEVIDQVNVTKQLQQRLPYIDSTRTAIWGWSYGGYAAGMALAMDTEGIFKCGISVAPVTDWTLYDSIYTERFMGLPTLEDNFAGYTEAQLLKKYAGLKDKLYFLIHGTFDDNVHYQQSMMWAKVLERNDILFRQLSYTDEDHSLASVRPHLYHSLENFLDECFLDS